MTSILVLLGVAVIGVCILAIALSDRQRVSTIAEVDIDVEPRQPDRSNTPTRLSGLDQAPAAGRTFAALSSRTSSWRPAPPARLQ